MRINQRISQKDKEKNDYRWYKDNIDELVNQSNGFNNTTGLHNKYNRLKSNYDLYNNIIDHTDFKHIINPYSLDANNHEVPADFTAKDILSSNIKVVQGLERVRPFEYSIMAINDEAIDRKKNKFKELVQKQVQSFIMQPIMEQVRMEKEQQLKGKELTAEEQEKIKQEIQQEIQQRTPKELIRYMERDYTDPVEHAAQQIINFLGKSLKLEKIFNDGWKHALLAAEEVYYVSIVNDQPCVKVCNPIYLSYPRHTDSPYIHDREWVMYEHRMSPSEVVNNFGEYLTDEQIDTIYERVNEGAVFDFSSPDNQSIYTVSVFHAAWKSLRKIGFLSYYDMNGEVQETIVDETYTKRKEDISLEWRWISEVHEGYKIFDDVYFGMRPTPGQYKDLNNIYKCNLPYIGAVYDEHNSQPTSLVDRVKTLVYLYIIIFYRLELTLAADKGKKMIFNLNSIPKKNGVDLQKWMHYFDILNIAFIDPSEEGNRGVDVTQMAKEIDLSRMADISKYIQLLSYIEEKVRSSLGITPQMLGEMQSRETNQNAQRAIQQSGYILEPYFSLHNEIKKEVFDYLLEIAKITYGGEGVKKIAFATDDMTQTILEVDGQLLEEATLHIYTSNSTRVHRIKETIESIAGQMAANNAIDTSTVIRVLKAEGIVTAEEILKEAERERTEQNQQIQQQQIQEQKEAREMAAQLRREEMNHERDMIVLKERERRETELTKQAMLSMGFAEDKDVDKDGRPDVFEIYQFQQDAEIKARKQNLDEAKFMHQQRVDQEKLKIDRQKSKNSK